MKHSVKLCLVALALYFGAAIYGEVQYRVAKARDISPAYNVVNEGVWERLPLVVV